MFLRGDTVLGNAEQSQCAGKGPWGCSARLGIRPLQSLPETFLQFVSLLMIYIIVL